MTATTKFADMPVGDRNRWLAWADSHDWGGGKAHFYLDTNDKLYLVTEGAVWLDGPNNGWTTESQYSETPAEMRAWAGY